MPSKPIIYSLTTMHEAGMSKLREAGELRMATSLQPEVLRKEIVEADALVIRTAGVIDAALMDAGRKLRVIGRHGVGYDQVDVPAATERGILVVYTPGANTESVAEHAIAMMIGVSKHFSFQCRALVEGRYNDRTKLVGRDLAGRTLGIVGFGRIGRRVGAIARQGLGMNVVFSDVVEPPRDAVELAGAERVTFERLLEVSDYVTMHVPLDASTREMINRESISRMKPDAVLINTCRGPVVEETAVRDALESGRLFGYGSDVFKDEPPPSDHPLIGRTDLNILLTPHSAAQTAEGLYNMATEVASDVVGVLEGKSPRNPVNDPKRVAENRARLGLPPLDRPVGAR